ncbi:MAG TPA: hypothetical protein VGD87_03795 [Archangium sp.]
MTLPVALVLATLAAAPLKLAAPEWQVVNIPPDLATFYANEFARALRAENIEIVTSSDMATVIGLERQRALLGCGADAASCIAELGAALGCDSVLVANLARLDDSYQGSVRVISSISGKTVASVPVKASGQRALADALERAAVDLARQLRPPPPATVTPPRAYAWIPLVGAVALGAGAGVSFGIAGADYDKIPSSNEAEGTRLANEGRALQTAGWAMAGVGAAALITSGVLFLLKGEAPAVTPQVNVTSSGASVGLSGVFP